MNCMEKERKPKRQKTNKIATETNREVLTCEGFCRAVAQ